MKQKLLIILLLATFAIPSWAQSDPDVAVEDRQLMQKAFDRIARSYFKPRRKPTTVYFSPEHLKEEWLPKIRNIKFVLVKDGCCEDIPVIYRFAFNEKKGRILYVSFAYEIRSPFSGFARYEIWGVGGTKGKVRVWRTGDTWQDYSDSVGKPLPHCPPPAFMLSSMGFIVNQKLLATGA